MCGIGGLYKMAGTPIREWQVRMLALSLEYRGNDATGIALIKSNGGVKILKNNEPAWKFVSSKSYKEWMDKNLGKDTRIALVHTRKATKGFPYKNENNHPMYAGEGVVIHNGWISNDDGLFTTNKKSHGWKRSAETDSDAIRGILDCHGGVDLELINEMSLLEGVAAVAAYHPQTPDKLLLLRDSNPLILGATKDFLAFASDKQAIHNALKPFIARHNIVMQVHAPDLSFVAMPNETGWIIGPRGYEAHAPFKCNGIHRQGNFRYYPTTDYHEKRERQKPKELPLAEAPKEAPQTRKDDNLSPPRTSGGAARLPLLAGDKIPAFIICPNLKCSLHLEAKPEHRAAASLAELKCKTCGTNLAGALDGSMIN